MAKDNPSIDDRIDRVNQVIDLYLELVGDDDDRSLITDVLSDIMHMAHDQGWKMGDLLKTAKMNFEAEQEEEGGEEEEEEYDGEEDDDNEEEEE